MTGFGQASGESRRHAVTVALRAVNHRFLDVQLRLDEALRGSETALRERIAARVARGRVEARVEARPLAERPARVELHMGAIRAAHAATHELVSQGLIAGELTAGDLLRLPEAFRVALEPDAWEAEEHELLLRVADAALAQLDAGRELEGRNLAAALERRLDALAEVLARLEALEGPVREELAAGLARRVGELLGGQSVEEGRLAQEVALLADRGDVREELDRLASHLQHFREVMASSEAAGKRLDFLTQEVFRELNTLGAKCRHAGVVRAVLDGKVLCEQLREQVQNVE
ncbi:MAG TPA: YicC/YloC family endoribonuclease [Thermoanaerobaculia bacterium]|nr:YicC/YloC family endoribonuclease [Thermoanaerobaculia bacterium]